MEPEQAETTPEQDDLALLLRQLTPEQLRYVTERPHCHTDKEAIEKCKITKSSLARWKHEQPIEEVLRLMALDGLTVAREKLRRATSKAVDVLVDDIEHGRKHSQIRQNAAKDVLDRVGLKGADKLELTGKDGEALQVEYVNDWRSSASLPAPWAANGQGAGAAVQLAGSGETLEEDDAGHGDSS